MKLAKARMKKGITQAELARRMQLSRSCVASVESGHRRSWPRFRKLASDALGLTEEELFQRT